MFDIQDIITDESVAVKRVGYKTLRQFLSQIKKQNKVCKAHNTKTRFTIDLPIG